MGIDFAFAAAWLVEVVAAMMAAAAGQCPLAHPSSLRGFWEEDVAAKQLRCRRSTREGGREKRRGSEGGM